MPGMEQFRSLIANPVTIPLAAFLSFMSGPWSEEFGWRGVALDPMIQSLGVIPGTIGLGLVWGIWHLPLYFMPATWHGQMGFQIAGFWAFMLRSVGLALIMSWVYLNTNRSIFSGMLMHFTSNFTEQLIAPASDRYEVVSMFFLLMTGVILCAQLNRRSQTAFEEGKLKPAQ